MAKKIPELNAGSMADIAFLLLIFFLVATTMDIDTGIMRKLPPPPEENPDDIDVKERNVFVVLINAGDQLLVEGKYGNINTLKNETKHFFTNPTNSEALSEQKEIDIDLIGEGIRVTKGVVSLQNDRGTSYDMYIKVQNELAAAINELREEASQKYFGKPYKRLNEDQQKAIQKAVPMPISEAEPKDVGGN